MLFTGILLLLISNAVTFRRDKSILFARLTILILTNCSILLATIISFSFLSKSISLFGGLVYCKIHTLVFTLFIFALTVFILSLSSFYPRKVWHESATMSDVVSIKKENTEKTKVLNKMGEQFRIIEYPLIILFVITGATFLIASSDLVTIFLAIELQSYGLYLLSTIYRNSELSTNAGLTYFLLGGLSSCIILLGQSLLYINSGNTNLDGIYIINSILVNNVDGLENTTSITNIPNIYQYYIQLSFVIMSVGLLFKISSAPFHFWSPDRWSGKSFNTQVSCIRGKLPNSGDTLKLLVPSYSRKTISGWTNYSGKVITQKMIERQMGNRGSKSVTSL